MHKLVKASLLAIHEKLHIVCPGLPLATYLETLNNAWHNLMLKATVFSLCVLSNGHQIHVVISCLVSWYAEAWSDIGVKLELFP